MSDAALIYGPEQLDQTSHHLQTLIAIPMAFTPLTDETIDVTLPIASGRYCCVHLYTVITNARGTKSCGRMNLLSVVITAAKVGSLATAKQRPSGPLATCRPCNAVLSGNLGAGKYVTTDDGSPDSNIF